jgi:hypothetical protein
MSATPEIRARRALLIGIDDYPKLNKLEGCVNDVELMHNILWERFAFPPENLTLLRNAQATRDAILSALDALVESTNRNDIIVIHYAGHGSQMTDREGDEPDGMDETIMPYDSEGRWGINRDITDDEIHLRLIQLGEKTPHITLIFDSCHSGTITRDTFGARSRSMDSDTRLVSQLPPSPIPKELWSGLRGSGPSGWAHLSDRYLLIAGCRDEETSFEYRPPEGNGKVTHGAMTYFLCRELGRATSGTSYRDVFERMASQVNAANPKQHPQMEGRADREIFGVTELEPMRFIPVISRSGDSVTLGAGLAHGMTLRSRFAVYPQGAKRTIGVDPIGEIEITEVRAVTAEAGIREEKVAGSIRQDARAVESVHMHGKLRLAVQLVADGSHSSVQQLRTEVAASLLLQLVGNDEAADLRVYLLAPRDRVVTGDPVPQVEAVSEPTWAVVGREGQLVMPLKQLDAVREVKDNLEKLARYEQTLKLENPDPDSELRGKFSLELLRQRPDGAWVPAEPESAGGDAVFEEGEAIAFRISSRHQAPVYLSLLDFGLTGRIGLIYPPGGAKEQLGPGKSFTIGARVGERPWKLRIPRAFPFAEDPTGTVAIEGTETLKLFVTAAEADFRFLEQEGVRGNERERTSPLELLWRAASFGAATRDAGQEPVGQEDWTTVVRPLLLRRPSSVLLPEEGRPVRVGDSSVCGIGISGLATMHPFMSPRAEVAELTTDALTGGLADAGVQVQQTIQVKDVDTVARASRNAQALGVEVPDPGPEHGQMILETDELGVLTWHFAPQAEPASRGEPPARGLTRRYLIPAPVPAVGPVGVTERGLVGAVGSKFLKVLVFPLLEPGIGQISDSFALKWEQKHRPYRIRTFTPDDYSTAEARALDVEGWKRLSGGRALLMIHGTFSRAHSAFGALPREFVTALHHHYDGRVFAFDHFTLSHDPKQNVNALLERIPDGTRLDLDIVCHSRGGLVARLLTERQGDFALGSRKLRIANVVFVGTPNAGTTLADAEHVGDFIDTYTNLLNFIPDVGISDVLGVIVTVAKQLAVGVAKGLPGLQSMRPGGDFATWLNAAGTSGGETRYFSLSSNFTPNEPGLRELAADRLMDRIFKAANDLVVPTESVFSPNGSSSFPIKQRFVFEGSDGVGHTGYFANRDAREKILEWLGAGVPATLG